LTFVVAPVLGIITIIIWARSGKPVFANLGFKVTNWSVPDLLIGFAITFVAILGVLLVEVALGVITVAPAVHDLNVAPATFADIAANAAVEELVFRSLLLSGLVVILGKLSWGANRWVPLLISAVVFGLVHATNPGASPNSVVGNALGGLIYGMAFLGARNIWFPFGLHLGWNFAQSLLGLPVSGHSFPGLYTTTTTGSDLVTGGAFGPEAGVIGIVSRFVVIAVLLGYLMLRYKGGSVASVTFAPDPEEGHRPITPGRAGTEVLHRELHLFPVAGRGRIRTRSAYSRYRGPTPGAEL
jgi:hypothetical protein